MEKRQPVTTDIETNWSESVDSFDDLNLKEDLLRGIYGNLYINFFTLFQSRSFLLLLFAKSIKYCGFYKKLTVI
jgi:hypothetical protein